MKQPVAPLALSSMPEPQCHASAKVRTEVEPKLAVIITCYNYAQYIKRAIRSVQLQGCNDCELVVVDDGSTDNSWDVIRSMEVRAFRIENHGQRGACIYGLGQTTAPFVLFLDADDELLPGSLQTIIAKLDPEVAKLQFPLTRVDRNGMAISRPLPQLRTFRGRQLAQQVLLTGAYASPPTSGNVFRRDICLLLDEAEYDRAVDGVILFAAPFFGDVVSLSEELGLYRVHDCNDSGFGGKLNPRSLRRGLQRFVDRMEHLRQVLSRFVDAPALVQPDRTYFYQEHRFYLAIAENERIRPGMLARLLARLWSDDHPVRAKTSMTVFYIFIYLLPNERARRGVAYRLRPETRSLWGFLKVLIGQH